MRKPARTIISFAVLCMCGAAPVWAGPMLYALSDPNSSSGTEKYVIDPIAATITVVRGVGIGHGGAGSYGGVYGGGHGGTQSGTGNPGIGGMGAFGGFGGGGSGSPSPRGSSTVGTGSPVQPNSPLVFNQSPDSIDIVPQRAMIVLSDDPQPEFFGGFGGKSQGAPAGAPQLPDQQIPGQNPPTNQDPTGPGCVSDCGGPSTILADCTGSCAGDPLAPTAGGLEIAAVPEPTLLGLLGIGLAGLGIVRRRKPV